MKTWRQVSWVLNHPASKGARTLIRAADWMVRSAAHRPAVVPFGDDLRFYCPAESRGMARLAYLFGEGYEPELEYLDRLVGPGDAVIDLGAAYGSYTIKLARLVGCDGSVLAVEPASHAIQILTRNIALNGLRNVRVEQVAVGESTGETPLYLQRDRTRNRTVGTSKGSVGVEYVRVVRLDDLVRERIAYVKMDVEGAELFALRGAEEVLAVHRPIVQVEYTPLLASEVGADPAEVWQRFERHRYVMHQLVSGALRRVSEAPPSGTVNLFALPDEIA